MTLQANFAPREVLSLPTLSPTQLVDAFYGQLSPRTLEGYRADLKDFATFVSCSAVEGAAQLLLSQAPGHANSLTLLYKNSLKERGLAASTINRRLAARRSLVKLARVMGLVTWTLEVAPAKAARTRDVRRPDPTVVVDMLNLVRQQTGSKAVRDYAILRMLYDWGLRVSSVVNLDLADVDLNEGIIYVTLKGHGVEKKRKTLPLPTRQALQAWTSVRGADPGPLFTNFDRAGKGGRLTRRAVHYLVRRLGDDVGCRVWPHASRLTAFGGDSGGKGGSRVRLLPRQDGQILRSR